MIRLIPLLALPLALAGLLEAQEDVARTVRELLRKLRSDQIEERDAAQTKLKEIGEPALPDLIKAAQDEDVDYSSRVRALLKGIARDADPLLNPAAPAMAKPAPEEYKVRLTTSQGAFTIKVTRSWAPLGADRFYNLVRHGFYNDCRFFRVIAGFVSQFGLHGDPKIAAVWKNATIQDDPVKDSNKAGRITFATRGANSRTTQVFINLKDNTRLDTQGFAPFGEVVEGMEVVRRLYADYGEGPPTGHGPQQGRIQSEGNPYLAEFPKLDVIRTSELLD
ncbi:MAG TPA: peptidylprolyl isomerase [Planctomycetota bacterium]|nr:peptidylprolyl isomerase [Planctomycetota bacterium]